MTERFIESLFTKPDEPFEQSLRPKTLVDFVGQKKVCEQLDVLIKAAQMRNEPLGHILFSGPPGLGKTSLSYILAESMDKRLVVTSGPAVERPADLAIELSSLREGEILFIDEIHRMNKVVEEYLYSAMEDFVLDIPKSARIPLAKFTLVGATTRPGLLSAPFRSRFMFTTRLDFYDQDSIVQILRRSSRLLGFEANDEALAEIAKRSRATPRVANRLLRWVRDYVAIRAEGKASKKGVEEALQMLQIDDSGLDEMDFRILHSIVHQFDGGPVGLQTLATAVSEESDTVEDVHEPFLISLGFMKKTPKGREATVLGIEHVRRSLSQRQQKPSSPK
jgi:holliday junction DNA helicase RuvB